MTPLIDPSLEIADSEEDRRVETAGASSETE